MAIRKGQIFRVIFITLFGIATAMFLYLMINNFQIRRGVSVKILFNRIGALNVGTWVRKSGVKIGSVTKIEIDKRDQRSVFVTITMKPGIVVRKGDRFAIVVRGLMGDQYIEVLPAPPSSPPVKDGYVFKGEPMLDLSSIMITGIDMVKDIGNSIRIIADLLTKNEKAIARTIQNLEETSESVKEIVQNAKELTDTVPELTDLIGRTTKKVDRIVDELDTNISGILNSSSSKISVSLDNLKATSDNLKEITSKLTGESSLLSILNEKELQNQIPEIIGNLHKMSVNLEKLTEDLRTTFEGVLNQ